MYTVPAAPRHNHTPPRTRPGYSPASSPPLRPGQRPDTAIYPRPPPGRSGLYPIPRIAPLPQIPNTEAPGRRKVSETVRSHYVKKNSGSGTRTTCLRAVKNSGRSSLKAASCRNFAYAARRIPSGITGASALPAPLCLPAAAGCPQRWYATSEGTQRL